MDIGIFGKTIWLYVIGLPPLIEWGLADSTESLGIYPKCIARSFAIKSAFHDAAPPLTNRRDVFLVVTIFIPSQCSQSKTGTVITRKELIPLLRFFRGEAHPWQASCRTKCVMIFLSIKTLRFGEKERYAKLNAPIRC